MPKRTAQQNKVFHSLLAKRGFDTEAKAEFVFELTKGRTEHSSEMTIEEMNFAIEKLGGSMTQKPTRTVNYHRQKTGVKAIITPEQNYKINQLSNKRGMTAEALEKLCLRTIKRERPQTTEQGKKIIEALKSMIERDKLAAKNLKEKEITK